MLSFPHLVVLFVIALIIFGPQKLPELARMLGKATAEFRKMTNDFRYALEDEVRELERQTRIRDEEVAAAARAAETVRTEPENSVPRPVPIPEWPAPLGSETQLDEIGVPSPTEPKPPEPVTTPPHDSNEKPSDDNSAV